MTSVDRDLEVNYLCDVNENSWYIFIYLLTYLLTYDVTIRGRAFVRWAFFSGKTTLRGIFCRGPMPYLLTHRGGMPARRRSPIPVASD